MDPKELALSLANCETEDGVVRILKNAGLWNDPNRWRDFGDNENNWATIGNQQSNADTALVEKIVNSVDALLMKDCLVRGIDPTSNDAPNNLSDALMKFYGVPGGSIANLNPRERVKMARDNIILAATGENNYLNLTLVDKGEGQTPQKMPETILSINKSNKLKIPFVQGKFNMGGTGVLSFCGSGDQSNNFQLIISKRCPEIAEDDKTQQLWGFTIIRREAPRAGTGMKSSKYTYLVGSDQNVMSFMADSIPVIPVSGGEKQNMKYGMFCKLFDYNLPTRLKSAITINLFFRLSTLLPEIAFPVFLEECRGEHAGDTLTGLNVRLNDQYGRGKSSIEERLPVTFKLDGQEMNAVIWVFKAKNKGGNKLDMRQYRQNEGILLIQNGQTQGSYDKRFFNRERIGLGYLADYLLMTVDCSKLDGATCESLFMNSRDRTRCSTFANKLESKLEEFLKNNEVLKEIQMKRREETVREKMSDEKPLEDVLSNVCKKSPVLRELFIRGERLKHLPMNLKMGEKAEKFIGKFSPTYFLLIRTKGKSNELFERKTQLGRYCRIRFKTDACDDFFSRDKYPGIFSLTKDGSECEDRILSLKNGIAVLEFELPPDAKEGEKYSYVYTVTDTKNGNIFSEKFIVAVIANQDKIGGGNGRRTPPDNGKQGKETPTYAGISLPNIFELTHEDVGWDECGFHDESAVAVVSTGENVYDFYINMDNIYLQAELKSVANDKAKIQMKKARFVYSEVLISLGILNYTKQNLHVDRIENSIKSPEENVRLISEMVSPVILPIIESLGENLNDTMS